MSADLTVILQGGLSPRTTGIIEAFRQAAPGCEIILSTWVHDSALETLVDQYVVSPDPGSLPVQYQGQIVRTENTNRQIVSTCAGMSRATRRFAIKWRTDFDVDPARLANFLKNYTPLLGQVDDQRIVVMSINSTNPFAGIRLVGQLSDWMYFAHTEVLLKLLPKTPIPALPENLEVPKEIFGAKVFPFARFSAEQWMLREGLERVYGVRLESYNDKIALPRYLRLIGRSILFVNPSTVGLVTHKYDRFFKPQLNTLRDFIGFRLATISEFDGKLFSIPGCHWVAVCGLRLKGLLFNAYKYVAEYIRS
jgi:hypothetical protein